MNDPTGDEKWKYVQISMYKLLSSTIINSCKHITWSYKLQYAKHQVILQDSYDYTAHIVLLLIGFLLISSRLFFAEVLIELELIPVI